jgi:hypothetical protein
MILSENLILVSALSAPGCAFSRCVRMVESLQYFVRRRIGRSPEVSQALPRTPRFTRAEAGKCGVREITRHSDRARAAGSGQVWNLPSANIDRRIDEKPYGISIFR